jgi:hypothetical protein
LLDFAPILFISLDHGQGRYWLWDYSLYWIFLK